MSDFIHENELYGVCIGKSVIESPDLDVYQVVNKMYKVVEIETTVLPRAIAEAEELSHLLDTLNNSEDIPPELTTH